jgi:UDP-N-acetylmuramate--alanine ligase
MESRIIAYIDGDLMPAERQRVADAVAGQHELVFAQDLTQLEELVRQQAHDGDVVMCMGAGSIGQLPVRLQNANSTDKPVLKVVKS